MNFQHLFHTRYVTKLGLFIGKYLPRRVAVWLAKLIGWWLTWRKPALYRTVVGNLRHVFSYAQRQAAGKQATAPDVDEEVLRQTARRLFTNAGQTYYDFYRALNLSREQIVDAVSLPSSFLDYLRRAEARGEGILIMALHTSNFDLAALSLGASGFVCQALSVSNPPGGFSLINRLRTKGGHDITPLSPGALRKAVSRLKEGGIVATGVDFPTPSEPERPLFFGEPSYLPIGPARLALLGGATMFVVSCEYDVEEGYRLNVSDPIKVTRPSFQAESRRESAAAITDHLARIAEDYILRYPDQWMMFNPLWRDVAEMA